MDALIVKFVEAAHFIEDEIYGKLIPAKMQAVEVYASYGGGAVPFGFKEAHKAIVDRDGFMYAFSRLSKFTLDGEIGVVRETRKQNTTAIHISLSYADATLLAALGFPLSVTPAMAAKLLPDADPDDPERIRSMAQDYLHPEIVQRELMEQYLELAAK